MKNKKIVTDRPELSNEQILKFKNYEKVKNIMNNQAVNGSSSGSAASSGSFFSSAGFYAIIGVVAICTTLSVILTTNNNTKEIPGDLIVQDTIHTQKSVINPPAAEFITPYEEFVINNSKDTTIISSSGSLIHLEPNSFCKLNGDDINTDEINIKYREFHTPYDFFVNGIPMKYDSAGINYTFQSAGMLEFLAYAGNEVLEIKDNKEVAVDMVSYDSRDIYNQYYLDTTTGEWQYLGKDDITKIPFHMEEESNDIVDNECNQVYIEKIHKPVLRDKTKYSFTLDVDKQAFPELSDYENVIFEVDDEKCEFDQVYYSVEWENSEITQSKNEGEYVLTLSKSDREVILVVYPVYDESSYQKAIEAYNKEKEEIEKKKQEVLDNRKRQNNDIAGNENLMMNQMMSENFTPAALRRMRIRSVGFYNCDKPVLPPNGKDLKPVYAGDDHKLIDPKMTYLVEKDQNVLYNFVPGQLVANPKKENVFWLLTQDNKIALPDKNINEYISEKNRTLNMKEYDCAIGLELIKQETSPKPEYEEGEKIEAKIFPNPVKDNLNIELSESCSGLVQIIDDQGRQSQSFSFKDDKINYDVKHLQKGTYIVTIIIQNKAYKESFKVVKI